MGNFSKDIKSTFQCGYITILGRPNVGKSTLLNHLLDQKISITSRKPQTTRSQVLGIKTDKTSQAIYIDTPGIQKLYDSPVHRLMNSEAKNSLDQVDIVIFMIEALKWSAADKYIVNLIRESGLPVITAINKIDKVKKTNDLLPFIDNISVELNGFDIVPVSAKSGDNVNNLEQLVLSLLPHGPRQYSDDYITNRSKKFLAAEFIREKLINRLGDELPYRITVTIEEFKEETGIVWIKAIVWVEGKSQKNIVIGKNGKILKLVGEAARKDLERLYDKKVFLESWVKVMKNWSQSNELLAELGLTDNQT
ncbi:MAG: GTPase Era [Gammaproteobacteria bacterium]|jgi:GTP-binding protein Era